jgi:hypothetical protein
MKTVAQAATTSKARLWGGWIISSVVVLFLVFDGITKVLKVAPVVEASARLGLPISLTVRIGILVLILAALYVVPSTSILGAILLTGFLGGAVAIQLRAGSPLFSEALFPVYFAMFVWGGLFLRDGRVRALISVRG